MSSSYFVIIGERGLWIISPEYMWLYETKLSWIKYLELLTDYQKVLFLSVVSEGHGQVPRTWNTFEILKW